MSENKSFLDRAGGSRPTYGTSRSPYISNLPQDSFEHGLEPGDTLQGLALKYNVRVEAIKRLNKLFTNESIHSRTILLIPKTSGGASAARRPTTRSLDVDSGLDDRLDPSTYLKSIDQSIEETTEAVKRTNERISRLESELNTGLGDDVDASRNGIGMENAVGAGSVTVAFGSSRSKLTSGRAVERSMQALEKKEDEMFEL
eukprot:m.3253 g.3253  ORF g.3253 m.3253 type:complete len:201 (+) comp9188_c0_seq2:31-633(+)